VHINSMIARNNGCCGAAVTLVVDRRLCQRQLSNDYDRTVNACLTLYGWNNSRKNSEFLFKLRGDE
jgi:hypothetical protein